MNHSGAVLLGTRGRVSVEDCGPDWHDHFGLGEDVRRSSRNGHWGWYLRDGKFMPDVRGGSRQFWSECLAWATADGVAITNLSAETIVFPNVTIPANFMQDGRALRLTAFGRWGNVVTAVPTVTWRVRWGGVAGTVLIASPAIVTPASAVTAAIWQIEAILQTRSNGATGTIFGMGKVSMFEDAAATFGTVGNYGVVQGMASAGAATPAVATVDLTADSALSLTAQWSAANASNAITGHVYSIEALN